MNSFYPDPNQNWRLVWSEVGDPSGLAVIHCHGGLSCRLETAFADHICKEQGIRWITADRPGIGASDRQPDRQLTDWANDMAALANHLQLDRFAVSGWSAGGPYALACGAVLGDRVSQVITLAGMAPLRNKADIGALGMATDRFLFHTCQRSPRIAALGLASAKKIPQALLRASIARMLANNPDTQTLPPDLADQVTLSLTESLRIGAMGTVLDYRLLADDWGFDPQKITSRVDIWHGDKDQLLPFTHAQRLLEMVPQASLQRCQGAGHFLPQAWLTNILSSIVPF